MPFQVNTLIIAAAVLLGSAFVFHALRKLGLSSAKALMFLLVAWASGLVFGKLLYLLNFWISPLQNEAGFAFPAQDPFSGGFLTVALYGYSSVGGFLGAALGAWLFCRAVKVSFLEVMDACVLPALFMYGVVRIGCALYGCCYGIELAAPQSSFLRSLLINAGGRWLFPVQWLDSALSLLLCLFILWRSTVKPARMKRLSLFLLLYPLQRFLLEFLRGDGGRGMLAVFSTTQIICVLALIAWFVMYISHSRKNTSIHKL